MSSILAIARATITELRRQKLLIIPIIGVVLSLLALIGSIVVTGDDITVGHTEAELAAWSAGLGSGVGGAIYALIVGSSLIARELSDGTMLMLAARPIARWMIVVGRTLGAAAFVLGTLLGVCVVYGLVATLFAGSLAPLDDPLRAFTYVAPAVLLALCVGIAFSVQGRATAAIGSAVIVSAFAAGLAVYVDEWREEGFKRDYLAQDVQAKIPSHDSVVGPASWVLVRAMPYGVFAANSIMESERRFDGADGTDYSGNDRDRPIDVADPYGSMFGMAVPATAPEAADPNVGTTERPAKLPDDPPAEAFDCAQYNGADCFLGYRNAWRVKSIPARPALDDGRSVFLAWLSIPLWIGIASLLLTRRRDLA